MSTLIIAEAGVNHNGDIELAKKLIWKAADAGADIIKFQTFSAVSLATEKAEKAEYQKQNTSKQETQQDMLSRLELSETEHLVLMEECEKAGIDFFSTAFDIPKLSFLNSILKLNLVKVPSGEITNYPYLQKIGSFNKQVLLSTGMANLSDIEAAISALVTGGANRENITILHCTTQYPAPMESVNLRAMNTIQNAFKTSVGYSDHTVGITIPIAAVAMGATVIEKHLTLDKTMDGPDHNASIEPHEFHQMVQAIRDLEQAMGDGIKTPSLSEIPNLEIARKSIVAARDIAKGEAFTDENITAKRPGGGMSPMKWNNVVGKIAQQDFCKDDYIKI